MSALAWSLFAVSVLSAVLACLAVVVNRRRCRTIIRQRAKQRTEAAALEALRLEVLAHRAYLAEHEVQWIIRQKLPECGKCGLAFRQIGPKDFSHTYCPAE